MYKFLCSLLIVTIFSQVGLSQAPRLTGKQLEVKRKAKSLRLQAPISVVQTNAPEEFGTFVSSDDDGFVFYDIDRKTNVILQYTSVKKIKDGYGGYNFAQGRHTDHTKGIVIMLIGVSALAVLIGAAAAAK